MQSDRLVNNGCGHGNRIRPDNAADQHAAPAAERVYAVGGVARAVGADGDADAPVGIGGGGVVAGASVRSRIGGPPFRTSRAGSPSGSRCKVRIMITRAPGLIGRVPGPSASAATSRANLPSASTDAGSKAA